MLPLLCVVPTNHKLLLHKLEHTIRLRFIILAWFKSFLSNNFQLIHLHNVSASCNHDVPQGSIQGPFLFFFICASIWLSSTVRGREKKHFYVDDTPLYLSIRTDVSNQHLKSQVCFIDIRNFMSCNFLQFNTNEMEVTVFGTKK